MDCTDFDANSVRPDEGNLRDWVPLVYPDANASVPHVMLRLPLQPERPPTADKKWKQGDRVEVSDVIGTCCLNVYQEVVLGRML